MSEAIPEYILKKPISAEVRQRYDTENDEYSYWRIPVGDKYKVDLSKEVFNELFVPLDRQAKAEQIEESIAQVLLAHGLHPGVNNEDAELLGELKDAFWLLFGLENPGDNKNG